MLLVAAAGAFLGWRQAAPPDLGRWAGAIDRAAAESGLDPALLRALVAVESGGRPRARSDKGAAGLLQLLPETAREQAARMSIRIESEASLFEPETNLRLGAGYLARLLARFDGVEAFALAAYNAGPTRMLRWRAREPHLAPYDVVMQEAYPETRTHVARVLAWRSHYAR